MPSRHHPLWSIPALREPPGGLEGNAQAEVVVIGAGVAGLTTACFLAREGRSVIVLDQGPVGSGESGRTTAHLSCVLNDRYIELERWHGLLGARQAAQSHAAAINEIERIISQEGISCDFTRLDGYLFNPPESPAALSLPDELLAARRACVAGVELIPRLSLPALCAGPALRFPRQAQLHPLKYLAGLADVFTRAGGRIFAPSHVTGVQGGRPAQVRLQNGAIVSCEHVVVATNAPINDRLSIAGKQAACRTYVIAAALPAGLVPPALYWDTLDPYHYVRLAPGRDGDRLVVGGEDHRTGQADDADARYARLEAWARARFPQLGTVRARWSGQVLQPVDGLAYIGRDPVEENVYIATGDAGNGMTHGTIAGLVLNDLIHRRENHWTGLYDPSRLTANVAAKGVAQNINRLAQYSDWFTGGDMAEDEVARNNGAVIRQGLLKLAVYRDEHRQLHACSAICPHLGGIVRWNHDEKTFECPVHGSRFDRRGKVLNGPASQNLEPLPELTGVKPGA